MSQSNSPLIVGKYTAAADLSTKQYFVVKQTAATAVNLTSAATDVPFGVLVNKPTSGQIAEVAVGGFTKVKAGGTIAINDPLVSDANGKVVAATRAIAGAQPLSNVLGYARQAGVDGDIIEMEVQKLPY